MIRNVTKANDRKYSELKQYTEYEQNLIRTLANSVTLSLYKQWIMDDKKVPVERIIQLTTTMINDGLKEIIEK
jgi:hypothetical protein